MDNNKINTKNELNDRNPYSSGVGTNPYRSSGRTSPYSSGTGRSPYSSNGSAGSYRNTTRSPYNSSAASTNPYSSPYNRTASTYGNSAYSSSTTGTNNYSNPYSGTAGAYGNSAYSGSTTGTNTYSNPYSGTAGTNTYNSTYGNTGANASAYNSTYGNTGANASTYNSTYGNTPANTTTYNNLYAHSNTGDNQDNNTVGYSGSGSYVNTQDNSSAQYSQREFEESLKNSSKYTVVEQYNTNFNGSYNNTSSTSTTYSPYNSSASNPNYNMQNQYNPYNMGNATQNRDIFANMDSVKPDLKGERKRIALAMLAIAIIVISGFGIGKVASFLVNDVFKESSFSIESRLEEKYNIIVNTGSSADITEDNMDIEMLNDEENINKALVCLEKILDRLPEDFLDEVMKGYGNDRYLEINITGKMLRLTDNREVLGLTTYETYKDVIRLDGNATSWNEYKATVAHELFHVIDFEMDQFDEGIKDIRNWKATNPAGYGYSYTNGQLEQYTIYGDEIEEVYFVSEYSKEDVYEDRAEVFSYLISVDENDELPLAYESEHVQEKVVLLIEEMKDHFESADDADAYWNSWGIE